nr:zinc finger, CCHC-type [Tanacetum cinerariifolium]
MTKGESMKVMTSKFDKLVNFEGQDFRRWQKKMHFLLTTLKVVYVLSTPSPVWSENETLETTRKRMKWENDDYICRGHILNGMSDFLFDIYQNAESAKALWESLESKYMAEDAFATKFLVSNFMNYKMVDTRPVMEQYHEMLRILGQYTQYNLMMDEAISVVEGLRNQELDNNPKEKNQIGSSSINMAEGDGAKNSNNNNNKRKFKNGEFHVILFWTKFYVIEPNDYVSVNSIIESRDAIFDEERFTSIPRPRGMIQPSSSKIVEGTDDVPGPSVPRKSTRTKKAKSFGSDFQLYLVEGTRDKTLSQHEYCFIIEEDPRTLSKAMASRDVAFWKEAEGINLFDTYASVARISTIRLLLALAAIHDLVIHQIDVKTAFLYGDLDEEIYMKQPKGFVMPGHESKVCKLKKSLYGLKQAPKQWHQKFDDVVLSNGFSLNLADKCMYSKFDASVSQLEYSRAIGCLMYVMISTRTDIAFVVGKLSRYTSNPSALHCQVLGRVFQYLKGTMDYGLTYSGYPSVIEGYSDASWINNMKDHSSTSDWIFLLGGCAISWASKKQTCITSSTIDTEFVALAATGNEAGWLRNLIYEIPLWPKPISIISIRCDSAATLAKAYSQVYNGKSRHLGVRHSMICELIMNGVISVEFIRTRLNLADHLTKGLARDLVRKAAIGIGLKST